MRELDWVRKGAEQNCRAGQTDIERRDRQGDGRRETEMGRETEMRERDRDEGEAEMGERQRWEEIQR